MAPDLEISDREQRNLFNERFLMTEKELERKREIRERAPIEFGKLRVVRERAKLWLRLSAENGTTIEHEAFKDIRRSETLKLVKSLADSVFFKHGKRGFYLPYVADRLYEHAEALTVSQARKRSKSSAVETEFPE